MNVIDVSSRLVSNQQFDEVISPANRLADAADPDSSPADFVGDWVKRTLREKMVAMIMGADEEESGIPPLDYEL
jgi:hypothetical protein